MSWGDLRTSFVLAVAFGLILTGFGLVLVGTATSGSSGGCFFWPFPVIIACGIGSGATPYAFVIVGLIGVVLLSLFSLAWMRKSDERFE